MGDHLIRLSELLIQNNNTKWDVLLNALSKEKSITNRYRQITAHEGAWVLKKSLRYKEQQSQEPWALVMQRATSFKVSLKEDSSQF
jgi:hypothetical protein